MNVNNCINNNNNNNNNDYFVILCNDNKCPFTFSFSLFNKNVDILPYI